MRIKHKRIIIGGENWMPLPPTYPLIPGAVEIRIVPEIKDNEILIMVNVSRLHNSGAEQTLPFPLSDLIQD